MNDAKTGGGVQRQRKRAGKFARITKGSEHMQYPKKIMKMAEMEKLGFPREHLEYAYRRKGQTYAFKMNPTKKNSPVLFDTEEYEKWRIRMTGALK